MADITRGIYVFDPSALLTFLMGCFDMSKFRVLQAAIEEVTGLPEVLSPPLSSLMEGGLETPSIMGNLVPQAVNMWIGSSTQGLSVIFGKNKGSEGTNDWRCRGHRWLGAINWIQTALTC